MKPITFNEIRSTLQKWGLQTIYNQYRLVGLFFDAGRSLGLGGGDSIGGNFDLQFIVVGQQGNKAKQNAAV